jgi:hypothetical protein
MGKGYRVGKTFEVIGPIFIILHMLKAKGEVMSRIAEECLLKPTTIYDIAIRKGISVTGEYKGPRKQFVNLSLSSSTIRKFRKIKRFHSGFSGTNLLHICFITPVTIDLILIRTQELFWEGINLEQLVAVEGETKKDIPPHILEHAKNIQRNYKSI